MFDDFDTQITIEEIYDFNSDDLSAIAQTSAQEQLAA